MANNKNLVEVGKDTRFSSDNQPENKRGASIRTQLKNVLSSNGQYSFPACDIIGQDERGVTVKVPTQLQIAMRLTDLAMHGKGNEALAAMKILIEQVDGKPKQEIEADVKNYDTFILCTCTPQPDFSLPPVTSEKDPPIEYFTLPKKVAALLVEFDKLREDMKNQTYTPISESAYDAIFEEIERECHIEED